MSDPIPMVELWRGDLRESVHLGHAVAYHATGGVIESWGDPDAVIYPRSSCKMLQALPMVEAGVPLSSERMALACASHEGASVHVNAVRGWLDEMGMSDDDLVCGRERPRDRYLHEALIREGSEPEQVHNQCSGKHAGFLQFHRHLRAKGVYVDPDGPVQKAVRTAFEELTGMKSPGYGIDGCAAPNFATTVTGLARAMAAFAAAEEGQSTRRNAMYALRQSMMAHPFLVAGQGKTASRFMEAAPGRVAVKPGAEGVYVAILPERRIGIALKIVDGAGRAADTAMAALLTRFGIFPRDAWAVRVVRDAPILNRAGVQVGVTRTAPGFL